MRDARAVTEKIYESRDRWVARCVEVENGLRDLLEAAEPFAAELGLARAPKCTGNHDTGYVCGVDSDGRDIYGFTDFCRWCSIRRVVERARELLAAASVSTPKAAEEGERNDSDR